MNIDPATKKITWALRELLIVLRSVWSELSAFKRFWAVLFNCKIKYVTTKLVNQQSVGIYPQESKNRRWILLKIGNLVPRALFRGFVWGGPGNLKRLRTRLHGRSDKRCRSFSTRERLQRHSVSPAWRLDRETRRRLMLQETWFTP